ncbi:uncharacterized protein [Diadema antillarum]|uniref:uncharacterized protein n=1 Tax=Diadema antillarum TaxID=105358 RepID=UPI003A890D88
MLDSDDIKPVLAHHVTWIHNAPKCDSCAVMTGLGSDHPARDLPAFTRRCPHHSTSMERPRINAITQKSFPPYETRLETGFLPDIVQGKSMQRARRYDLLRDNPENDLVLDKDSKLLSCQEDTRHSSNSLPKIRQFPRQSNANHSAGLRLSVNTLYNHRLSRSLDMYDRVRQLEVEGRYLATPQSDSRKLLSGARTASDGSITDSGIYDGTTDEEVLLSRVSLDESASEGEEADDVHALTINPFPYETGRSPYENDIDTEPERPPTPIKPKKKKKKKKEPPPPPPKPRPKKIKRPYQRKKPINFAALRRHEQEVARRHPIRKQFLYSHILESELQSYIPARRPGGKLKPVYKRSLQTGDIMLPDYPITVEYTQLEEGDHAHTNSPWQITRRRQEALQAFIERRRKMQKHVATKSKRKRVRFILPPGHVDSVSDHDSVEDELDDDENHEERQALPLENADEQGDDANGAEKTEQTPKESNERKDEQAPDAVDAAEAISRDTMSDLIGDSTLKNSDELVSDWLQTMEPSRHQSRKYSGDRLSITDQFVKLPKISESEPLPRISLTLADDAQIIPILDSANVGTNEVEES